MYKTPWDSWAPSLLHKDNIRYRNKCCLWAGNRSTGWTAHRHHGGPEPHCAQMYTQWWSHFDTHTGYRGRTERRSNPRSAPPCSMIRLRSCSCRKRSTRTPRRRWRWPHFPQTQSWWWWPTRGRWRWHHPCYARHRWPCCWWMCLRARVVAGGRGHLRAPARTYNCRQPCPPTSRCRMHRLDARCPEFSQRIYSPRSEIWSKAVSRIESNLTCKTHPHESGVASSNVALDGHDCSTMVCARTSKRSWGRVCSDIVGEVTVLDFEQGANHTDCAAAAGVVRASVSSPVALVVLEPAVNKFHVVVVTENGATIKTWGKCRTEQCTQVSTAWKMFLSISHAHAYPGCHGRDMTGI